ncbi:hypothetical protein [Salinibacter ruber]|uniref:flagellin N-terminal helical domain-containing protein n=1 Tax=Salinibacter ruber TaxID=146919 RepID=UPI002434557C|nr:hypothetical protein [Salinibacter ruber]
MSSFSQINTNIQAQQAFQNLSDTSEQLADTRERLTTGLRINSASDDAAGFEIAEGLEARTGSQQQALRNIGDAKSALSVAEGGLDSQLNILQSAREKAVQAANGSLSQNERDAIAGELKEQVGEINDIAKNTTFNGDKLIEGGSSGDNSNSVGLTFQTGSESDQTFDVNIQNSTARDLGIAKNLDVSTEGQTVDAGDFSTSSAAVTTLTNGSFKTLDKTTGASTNLAGDLEGGTFEINAQRSGTGGTAKLTLSATGTSTTFTGANTSGANTTFSGSSDTLTLSSDGSNKIALDASNLNITTGQIGANETKTFTVEVKDSDNIGRRLEGSGGEEARDIIDDVDSAINDLTSQLSDLGASQNRLSFRDEPDEPAGRPEPDSGRGLCEGADAGREAAGAAAVRDRAAGPGQRGGPERPLAPPVILSSVLSRAVRA